MDIAICEDIEKDANQLRLLVERYFDEINCEVNIFVYNNGDDFLKDLTANKPGDVKIAFFDIYMPGTNGIETAKKIRETNNDMVIIFTTGSTAHSLDGYSVYALQYLIKPVEYHEVKKVLEICNEKFTSSLRYIEVLSDRLMMKVLLKDITFIEVISEYTYIHTSAETIKTFMRLHEFEKQLEGGAFLRTQRSFIVNMNYIKRMSADSFILSNDKEIPIRRSDKKAIKQTYKDYMFMVTTQE
ncbi:MAG: LytTR family DNA-binding domain-containing protein [Oscillospiraceae bacterium]|nr:LytTR family DNA-binding domain-containing protein [Oscillospiraceae bacterium]